MRLVVIDRDYSLPAAAAAAAAQPRNPEVPFFAVASPAAVPPPLAERVDAAAVVATVDAINALLAAAAVPTTQSVLANLMELFLFVPANKAYNKMLSDLDSFVADQNRTIYEPKGLRLRNPQSVAFIRLEFEVL
ncbi:hypothetical protein BDR26DRAFT_916539 [Obelidium mucronatum]|nr:hypothetical protein BDR26DRAFT_916539 [Obelidium mucronatum]